MIYPNMVYKNGKRGEYIVCNNAEEMVLAANDGFWPIHSTQEDILSNPSINRELQAVINTEEDKKKKDEVVKNVVKKNKFRRNNVK